MTAEATTVRNSSLSPSIFAADRSVVGGLVVAAVVLAASISGARALATDARPQNFRLDRVGGGTVSSETLKGTPAILAFCRTGQSYSEHVLYDLRDLSRQLPDAAVVAVFSGPTDADELDKYRKNLDLDFPIALDPEWKLYAQLGVVVRPTVWILDANGKPRFEIAGYHRDLKTQATADIDFLAGRISEEQRAERVRPSKAPSFEGAAGPAVRYKLARRLIESGKREAAKRQLELAWNEKPPLAMAGIELARILLEEGKAEQALQILDKALPMAPDDPMALGTKGLALVQQGKENEAVPLLRQAIEAGAEEPMFYYRLGRALERRGEAAEACGYFRRGFEILLERLEKASR